MEGSSDDLNQSITFKVYDTYGEAEYDVHTLEPVYFTGETEAVPSSPVKLYLTKPGSINLNSFVMNVDESVDLTTKLTVTPEGADLPNNMTWSTSDYFTITGNTITATAPNVDGVDLVLNYGMNEDGGPKTASAKVTILLPAESLTLNGDNEVTVDVLDNDAGDKMWAFLDGCYTLDPDNTTDRVVWTSSNTAVVGEPPVGIGGTGRLEPMTVGDAVLTGEVFSFFNEKRTDITPITVTVHVVEAVTSISTPFTDGLDPRKPWLDCSVGDDLTPYLVDGLAFTVLPADATNKAVTITFGDYGEGVLSIDANGKVTAISEGEAKLVVTSVENAAISTTFVVKVHNDFRTISVKKSEIGILMTGDEKVITSEILGNVTYGPSGAENYYRDPEPTSSNPEVVSIDWGDNGYTYKALQQGEAIITFTFDYCDYLAASFETSGASHVTTVSGSFKVIVSQGLTGMDVSFLRPDPSSGNYDARLVVNPIPAGVPFDASNLSATATYFANEYWDMDNILQLKDFEETNGGAEASIDLYNIPGMVTFTVTYDTGNGTPIEVTTDPQELGYYFGISGGWEWRTVPYCDFSKLNLLDVFGRDLVEIRTQNEQVYNDTQYGLFGDVDLMDQNVCFKMKTGEERPEVSGTYLFGGMLGQVEPITLRRGWNWIPNPYVFKRALYRLTGPFVEGDRIVSKNGGFAEYTDDSENLAESYGPSWTGTLEYLEPGQGYLFYNAGDAGRTLTFENEMDMSTYSDDYVWKARTAAPAKPSLFHYDASRFRDNMTIVAQLEGVANAADYQTYAFVGDECRGEGKAVGSRQFITVHANSGEKISFKFYNTVTGQLFDGDQTVTMQAMLGTVKAPYKMSSQAAVTGITEIDDLPIYNLRFGSDGDQRLVYDLNGRVVSRQYKGISIERSTDGTVRKTVVR